MSSRKRIFCIMGLSVVCISGTGCGFVTETDGLSRWSVLSYEENRRGRSEVTVGQGGWEHKPDTLSVHRSRPSAAVKGLIRRGEGQQ